MIPATFRQNDHYVSLKQLAAVQSTRVRGLADRDDGAVAILFVYETESSAFYFTTGYFYTLRRAVTYSRAIFQNEDIVMNIFKNNKLFPNIRGVMLKDKRITLHMTGKYNVVEMRESADARVELSFTDHEKTAVINRTQLLDIADVYGPETDDWKGKPVVLYGEEGNWFGKHQWGIRVDLAATRAASKKVAKAPASKKPVESKNGREDIPSLWPDDLLDEDLEDSLADITEAELDMISKMTAEEYNEYRVEMGRKPLSKKELAQYTFLEPGDEAALKDALEAEYKDGLGAE